MKFYVATKWENKEFAKFVMEALPLYGHENSHDWTVYTQENPVSAEDDLNGVKNADAVLFLADKDLAYAGALVECGAALGLGKSVYVLGDNPGAKALSVFKYHPLVIQIRSLNDLR